MIHGATDARARADQFVDALGRFLGNVTYSTCYGLSFGVVFPALLVVRAIPKENAFVYGMVDGGRAAIDTLNDMREGRLGRSSAHAIDLPLQPA
jgi:hypothetical protein